MLLGNARLMRDRGIAVGALEASWERLAGEGKTPMYVAIDGKPAGLVAVADTVKPNSKTAIEALQGLGIEVVMLTGDNKRTADAIARQVGIGRVLAEVLPASRGPIGSPGTSSARTTSGSRGSPPAGRPGTGAPVRRASFKSRVFDLDQ